MLYRTTLAVSVIVAGCSNELNDFKDRNRPPTYGSHCDNDDDCSSPFQCVGPPDAGPYWPICTVPCASVADCPRWNATGHCPGPITPVCTSGLCDYNRCE
jgi:hypothetical protein